MIYSYDSENLKKRKFKACGFSIKEKDVNQVFEIILIKAKHAFIKKFKDFTIEDLISEKSKDILKEYDAIFGTKSIGNFVNEKIFLLDSFLKINSLNEDWIVEHKYELEVDIFHFLSHKEITITDRQHFLMLLYRFIKTKEKLTTEEKFILVVFERLFFDLKVILYKTFAASYQPLVICKNVGAKEIIFLEEREKIDFDKAIECICKIRQNVKENFHLVDDLRNHFKSKYISGFNFVKVYDALYHDSEFEEIITLFKKSFEKETYELF